MIFLCVRSLLFVLRARRKKGTRARRGSNTTTRRKTGRKGGRDGDIFLIVLSEYMYLVLSKQKVEGWCCHHKAKKRRMRVFSSMNIRQRDRSDGERGRSQDTQNQKRGKKERTKIL